MGGYLLSRKKSFGIFLKLLSVLFITLCASTFASTPASTQKWTRYQDYKIHLDVPEGWRIERDLYGMPIMVLGPERNGERAVLSVQHTPIIGMEFDHASLIKTKDQYYQGRRDFVDNLMDAKYLSRIPYRHLKWANGNDGFEMGFRYQARGLILEEKSIQVNCGKRLFLLKTLSSNQIPASDTAILANLVNQLDCVATSAADGVYEPSPLQDLDRKFSNASPWPTHQQLREAAPAAKAAALAATVEFYKSFESAAGEEFYAKNKNAKENQYFAKIKDRMDRLFSVLTPFANAKDGFDCFFGGWPSKFVKKNSGSTCGYPWDTNPDYATSKSNCGDGSLACNPSLFGADVCVDVSNPRERSRATMMCELKFGATGKSYEDVVKDPHFDQKILDNTIDSAKEVCSGEIYISSNYGLCTTLKEKLGLSIGSGQHEKNDQDVKFINGLDEIKPDQFDEYVKTIENNYKEFETRCFEKGEFKPEIENCPEDLQAILSDLETLDKRSVALGKELQAEEEKTEDVSKNKNCTQADCGAEEAVELPPVVEKRAASSSSQNACTAAQEKRKKERECSWGMSMLMGGGCISEIITSFAASLWGTLNAVLDLTWDGLKWVGGKAVQSAKWFAGLFGYEDESSKKINTAAQTSNSAIEAFKKDPMNATMSFFKTMMDGVENFISNDLACEKWSSFPHTSTCLAPARFGCISCMDKMDGWCSFGGYLVGEIAPAFLTGGVSVGIKGTATAGKISNYLSKASKLGKLTRLETEVAKNLKLGKNITKLEANAARLKTGLGISGDLSKTQKIIGKAYNVSRWPLKKYHVIKKSYRGAIIALKSFNSTKFGGIKNTIAGLKTLIDKTWITKNGVKVINHFTIKPIKAVARFTTKIASAPVRLPAKFVRVQEKIYQKGLKYWERKINKNVIQTANMAKYPSLAKNFALYGSLSKYTVKSSHLLDEFRHRVSMDGKSDQEAEEESIKTGKTPGLIKAIWKKNRIDRLTYDVVMESLRLGKEPKDVDMQYLVKTSGVSEKQIRLKSIEDRIKSATKESSPVFTISDYTAYATANSLTPSAAKSLIEEKYKNQAQLTEEELKLQALSEGVMGVLNEGRVPNNTALQSLARQRNISAEDVVIESIEYRIMYPLFGETPVFSNYDFAVWAKANQLKNIEEAKKQIMTQVEESQKKMSKQSIEEQKNDQVQ